MVFEIGGSRLGDDIKYWYNLVLTLEVPLLVDGIALVVAGIAMLFSPRLVTMVSKRTSLVTNK